MNLKNLYIAVEINDTCGSVNDTGSVEDTPEKAWEAVSEVFHAPDTIICKLTQHSSVEPTMVPAYQFQPIQSIGAVK